MIDGIEKFEDKLSDEMRSSDQLDALSFSSDVDAAARKALSGEALEAQKPMSYSRSQLKALQDLCRRLEGLATENGNADLIAERSRRAMLPVYAVTRQQMGQSLGDACVYFLESAGEERSRDQMIQDARETLDARVEVFKSVGGDLNRAMRERGDELSTCALKILRHSPGYSIAAEAVRDFREATRRERNKQNEAALSCS